jgi:aspartyl-tRNA(Asn)/glutamyl-tRNA(Gln) amidotransferase subunit B
MEEGSLRVDANVSARPFGTAALGTKTEIKNMNSFSGVERALAAEFARQCSVLDRGERVNQQTMLWDASRDEVRPARSKEESHDYRYFPDPDLPPLRLARDWIDAQRRLLPELPAARRARFQEALGLPRYDAEVLTSSPALAGYFEAVVAAHGDAKASANWVTGEVLASLRETAAGIRDFPVDPTRVGRLLGMIRDGRVSHSAAKKVFAAMIPSADPPDVVAAREGLLQVGDDDQLLRWVDAVFAENANEAGRLAAGEVKLVGVLVGLAMKKSGGRADPRKLNQLIRERAGLR